MRILLVTMGMDIVNKGQETVENVDLSEAEIAMFNSKFIAYEGNNVSTANVRALLNTLIMHNQNEANNLTENYVIVTGDIELKSNDTIAPDVTGNERYSVKCKITENGLIGEIIIKKANSSISDMIDDAE